VYSHESDKTLLFTVLRDMDRYSRISEIWNVIDYLKRQNEMKMQGAGGEIVAQRADLIKRLPSQHFSTKFIKTVCNMDIILWLTGQTPSIF